MYETSSSLAVEPPAATAYAGPDRRAGASMTRWLALMLDEIDHGMLLLDGDSNVVHANHAARSELDAEHPLQLLGRQLRTRRPHDLAHLHDALAAASQRGLRRLLTLGDGAARTHIAVLPLAHRTALVVLGKRALIESLSVQCYARLHGLTGAETRVLQALCDGAKAREIAALHGVGLATVRTQIGNLRIKTGADDIRSLVRHVALLPPMRSALKN